MQLSLRKDNILYIYYVFLGGKQMTNSNGHIVIIILNYILLIIINYN